MKFAPAMRLAVGKCCRIDLFAGNFTSGYFNVYARLYATNFTLYP